MFGGHGSPQMLRIAKSLDTRQLVLLCGHHAGLAEALRALRRTAPHAVLGFTSQVQRYMGIADYFIGKPGPGALSEALQCGLPVLSFRNAWTMPQERYNAQWITERGYGIVHSSFRTIDQAVGELLGRLDEFRGVGSLLRARQHKGLSGVAMDLDLSNLSALLNMARVEVDSGGEVYAILSFERDGERQFSETVSLAPFLQSAGPII
jgi:hypothetical protein